MEIDRATFYALLTRGWQVLAGPVTLVLISVYFPPEVQGWFYVFAELLGLQALVEMSLNQIIINLASHEWSRLERTDDGSIAGDANAKSRLISLGRFFAKWYLGVGLLYGLAIGVGGGLWMSANSPDSEVAWVGPWVVVTIFTVLSLWITPIYALLDGCNQVIATNRFRAIQSILGNLAVWLCIPLGAGLWTTTAIALTKLAGDVFPLLGPYRQFFRAFFEKPLGPLVAWREEIAPLQWRLALQTGTTAIAMSSLTLVLFDYHGEAAAGRMGMTWSALKSLQWGAIAWVYTRVPKFGMLIASRDYEALDRMFGRVFRVSLGLLTLGGVTAWAVVFGLNWWGHLLADRLLSPLPLALLSAAVVLNHIPLSLNLYARAHKREPFVWMMVVSNLAMTLAVWFGGKGPAAELGAVAGFLAVLVIWTVPVWLFIWINYRKNWRA